MINPDLARYVFEAQQSGMTPDAIRAELIKVGWGVSEIDEALGPAPTAPSAVPTPEPIPTPVVAQTTPPSTTSPAQTTPIPDIATAGIGSAVFEGQKTNYIKTLAILGILLVVVVGGGAALWFSTLSFEESSQTETGGFGLNENAGISAPSVPDSSNTGQNIPVASKVPVGWKTYRNTMYGYEISYPPEFQVDTGGYPGTPSFFFPVGISEDLKKYNDAVVTIVAGPSEGSNITTLDELAKYYTDSISRAAGSSSDKFDIREVNRNGGKFLEAYKNGDLTGLASLQGGVLLNIIIGEKYIAPTNSTDKLLSEKAQEAIRTLTFVEVSPNELTDQEAYIQAIQELTVALPRFLSPGTADILVPGERVPVTFVTVPGASQYEISITTPHMESEFLMSAEKHDVLLKTKLAKSGDMITVPSVSGRMLAESMYLGDEIHIVPLDSKGNPLVIVSGEGVPVALGIYNTDGSVSVTAPERYKGRVIQKPTIKSDWESMSGDTKTQISILRQPNTPNLLWADTYVLNPNSKTIVHFGPLPAGVAKREVVVVCRPKDIAYVGLITCDENFVSTQQTFTKEFQTLKNTLGRETAVGVMVRYLGADGNSVSSVKNSYVSFKVRK